jgi:sterol desaturase/sphingolipid hydroxylase (fatty acid hydroxylase superfamily)
LIEDFGAYWTHRIIHFPILYQYIHKKHHEYNIASDLNRILIYLLVSVSAEYAHPIEFLLANTLPVALGPKLLGLKMHLSTMMIWITFKLIKTLSAHSGYSFPWDPLTLIPYGTPPEFHSYHHSKNLGNYGSVLHLWDTVFKTD